ncbi:hypothetical protein ACFFGT_09100 [Mucilaginibacter angelicae]|uniref:DUF3298 domain-containing protein n=1 Tax=Mucilaginibacter angelicae TaxID=869718 RepID=A0ABV6L4J2_9SPHI
MFGIFKKKKFKRPVQDWELMLMYKTLEKLPNEFKPLKEQIESGLFTSSLVGYSTSDPDYVAFSFSDQIRDFERKRERGYKITNIKVRDVSGNKIFMYTIYVSDAVIAGYAIQGFDKHVIDIISADTDTFIRKFYDNNNADYENLKKLISEEALKLIKPENVYEVNLKGRVFYHIEDLEDGDFIGIESHGQICKITHDPFEIIPLDQSLTAFLSK